MSTAQVMNADLELLPSEEDVAPPQSQRFDSRRVMAAAGLGLGLLALLASATAMGGGAMKGAATEGIVVEDGINPVYSAAAPPPATKFKKINNPGTYNLLHVKSGLYVNVAGGVMKNENNVQTYNNPLSADSQWDLVYRSSPQDKHAVFRPKKGPGFALNLAGGGNYDLSNVQIYSNPDSPDSHWLLFRVCIDVPCTDLELKNKYLIKSAKGDLFLRVVGNGREANVEVTNEITLDCHFILEKPQENGVFQLASPTDLPDCEYVIETAQVTPSSTKELVLNAYANGTTDETNVQLYTVPTTMTPASRVWTLEKVKGVLPTTSTNKWTLENKGAPQMYLNLAGGGANGQTNVQLYNGATNPDNQWTIYKDTKKEDQYVIQGSDGSYLNAAMNVIESNVQVGAGVGMSSRWMFNGVGRCGLPAGTFSANPVVLNLPGLNRRLSTGRRLASVRKFVLQSALAPNLVLVGGNVVGSNVQLGAETNSENCQWILEHDQITQAYTIRHGDGYVSKSSTSDNVELARDPSLGKWEAYRVLDEEDTFIIKSKEGYYYLNAYGSTAGDNVQVSMMTGLASQWKIKEFKNKWNDWSDWSQ